MVLFIIILLGIVFGPLLYILYKNSLASYEFLKTTKPDIDGYDMHLPYYDMVGTYYTGINFNFDCNAELVEVPNEHGKGGWAISVQAINPETKERIHLGYISEEDKNEVRRKLIKKGIVNGYAHYWLGDVRGFGKFYYTI